MLFNNLVFGQNPSVYQLLYQQHDKYKEEALTHRRFTYSDIAPLLEELKKDKRFDVENIGKSVESRPIHIVKVGTGSTKVLLWSQMHGDEPTATMAMFDLFNFLQQEGGSFGELRDTILKNSTLYFIPMLNPDGAEVFKRRNAFEIDLNRDALRLQSPEARLLKQVRDSLKPEIGFNLHDQSRYYTAGQTGKPATISFLAPPYDYEKSVNDVRARAMKLIVHMNDVLQQFIPGQVAKFSDDFEPRAFGDNIQKWGTSTILIESGGFVGDPEKQQIRKLNFVAILASLHAVATEAYKEKDLNRYYEIPENEKNLFDLVIRNVVLSKEGKEYKVDIGINREEKTVKDKQQFYYKSTIEEIGDMSVFYGYEELDAGGMKLESGKVYPTTFMTQKRLENTNIKNLLKDGYTHVMVDKVPENTNYTKLPINVVRNGKADQPAFKLEGPADFVLKQNGEVHYVIINGFVYNLKEGKNNIQNARID